jgi:Holliday junction resolvase
MKTQRAITRATMPPESEADVQSALIAQLCAAGYLVVRINGSGFKDSRGQYVRAYFVAVLNACAGFPDVLAMRGATFRLFEVKREGGKLSDAQKRFQNFAANFGVKVEVIEGRDGLDAVTAGVMAERRALGA